MSIRQCQGRKICLYENAAAASRKPIAKGLSGLFGACSRKNAESPSPRDCLGCLGLITEKMQKAPRIALQILGILI